MEEKILNGEEKVIRRMKGGAPVPGPGRPKGCKNNPDKKARKQLIEEYKDALAEALPFVSPALIKEAVKGNVNAIRELNDVIVEKAAKNVDVTSGGDKIQPILVRFLDKKDD